MNAERDEKKERGRIGTYSRHGEEQKRQEGGGRCGGQMAATCVSGWRKVDGSKRDGLSGYTLRTKGSMDRCRNGRE